MLLSGFVSVTTDKSIQLFYKVTGPLSGRPIILLSNPLGASTGLWDDFISEFSATYTIIRYDSRFHGQSPLALGFDYEVGVTIEDLAQDILKLLEHLEVDRLEALIGLSIGGGTVLTFGALHPSFAKHVVVIGTVAVGSPVVKIFNERIEVGRTQGAQALGEQSVRRWFAPEWILTNQAKVAVLEAMLGKQSIEGYTATVRALQSMDLWPYVEKIKQGNDGERFLFVVGENDGPVVGATKKLALAARSKSIIVKDSGHIVNVEQPRRFHEIVRNLL